jgi:hypothetical protein
LLGIGKKSILTLIEDLKTHEFKLKIEEKVVYYLSYHIVEPERENKIVMVQPHLFNQLIQKFKKEKIVKRIYKTQGTPKFKIQRPTKDMEVLDTDHQKNYHSELGTLL